MSITKRQYAQITGGETLGLIGVVLGMPLAQGWRLLSKPFSASDSVRTWRRVKAEGAVRFAVSVLNAHQLQFVDGPTQKVYEKWAPAAGVKPDVEAIAEDAQLLWITPRKRKRVIVYCHGGGYVLPAIPFSMTFWKKVTDLTNDKGGETSLVVLEYSLVPKAEYPVPLKQTVATIKHLINAGYRSEDIHLVGDSAGAALILQVLSHMLHPIQGITELTLPSKLGGAILISPWVTLDTNSPSFVSNANTDIFPPSFYSHLGDFIKPSVPASQKPYVEAVKAPKGWFTGVDALVSRVFITVGNAECLKDDIEKFAYTFTAAHRETLVVKIPGGTHNEPYGTTIAGDPDIGEWPSRFADWLV